MSMTQFGKELLDYLGKVFPDETFETTMTLDFKGVTHLRVANPMTPTMRKVIAAFEAGYITACKKI